MGRRSIRAVGANSTSSSLASRGTRRQLGVWLLLLLDQGRAAAPQLRDHEFWSEALQLPTLNKLDAVLKTYKGGCRRDARLHQQRRRGKRFMAFSWFSSHGRKGHCPLSLAHTVVLRPKASGNHRLIGITASPLRVLSRLRRPWAHRTGRRDTTPTTSGA